ncbi:Mu transposase domain-containing protein [Bifidobacterium adolescentis]|uniref:Mu transposase domain-containing protein n=1 Tax=Bifidobacterium adolescentis TaxID=1680 RepID=UPI003F56105E
MADWIYGRKARPNCHVAYARNWCSVPYAYAGATVDLRVGAGTIQALQHAPAPAIHGRQPVQHKRDRPAREDRMEAVGPGMLREVGAAGRPGLRRRRREAVRRATVR